MSWDVSLTVPRVAWASRSWNYTSNVNPMIAAAVEAAGFELTIGPQEAAWRAERVEVYGTMASAGIGRVDWLDHLGGRSGAEGARLLSVIVDEFERDPARYSAMDPPNGWGSLLPRGGGQGVLAVLRDMRDAALVEVELVWSVCR